MEEDKSLFDEMASAIREEREKRDWAINHHLMTAIAWHTGRLSGMQDIYLLVMSNLQSKKERHGEVRSMREARNEKKEKD